MSNGDLVNQVLENAHRKNLFLVISLRWFAIFGQLIAIQVTTLLLEIALPIYPMLLTLGGLTLFNLFSHVRHLKAETISTNELLSQLCFDLLFLSIQLYFSGGATNPFIGFYLLHIITASLLLPAKLSWGFTFLSFITYAILSQLYVPLLPTYHGLQLTSQSNFGLLQTGLFLAYLIIASLTTLVVTQIRAIIQQRDAEEIARRQKQQIEEDHIVRLGLLASGAAHELGTPLSTILTIVSDWTDPTLDLNKQQMQGDAETVQQQVVRCRNIVSQILEASGTPRAQSLAEADLESYLDQMLENWEATSQPRQFDIDIQVETPETILVDAVLQQSIYNVLDNALEVSPDWIKFQANILDTDTLQIQISDKGAGFDTSILQNLGSPYNSSKDGAGRGLGLFLTLNTIRKMGGDLEARNQTAPEKGCTVTLTLPLSTMRPTP